MAKTVIGNIFLLSPFWRSFEVNNPVALGAQT